jgi:hypothetical protein
LQAMHRRDRSKQRLEAELKVGPGTEAGRRRDPQWTADQADGCGRERRVVSGMQCDGERTRIKKQQTAVSSRARQTSRQQAKVTHGITRCVYYY